MTQAKPGWQALFQRAGFSRTAALKAARSRRMRDAAYAFNLPLMPAGMKPPRLCIDIGANSGEWSAAALTLFPGVVVHAFEPDPDTAKILHRTIGAFPNVVCHTLAAGAAPRTAPFHRYANSEGVMNSLSRLEPDLARFYNTPHRETIKVRIARLDDVLPKRLPHPLVLNIDVQGNESAVIDGGRRVLGGADLVVIEILFVPFYKNDADFWTLHDRLTRELDLALFNLGNLHRAPDGRLLWGQAIYIRRGAMPGMPPVGGDVFAPSLRLTSIDP